MAKVDDTYYEWFDLLIESRQNRPGRRRSFQHRVEPGSGYIVLNILGALKDDKIGATDEPAVALDITERLTGEQLIRFDGSGDTDFWLIDDTGIMNAFNWVIFVWTIDTGGVNDGDFNCEERKEWVI